MTNQNPREDAVLDEDGSILAVHVLLQAIRDVFGTHDIASCGDRHATSARSDAYAFLTATTGAWRQSRRDWCDLAGINPDAFERGIANRLARKSITVETVQRSHQDMLFARRKHRELSGEYMRNNLTRRAQRQREHATCS